MANFDESDRSLSPCAQKIRQYDHDRFLTTLFAPSERKDDLAALYAFNLELSKIRETVSEPLIGRMRLQFWRDAIQLMVDGNPPAHEVAGPLSEAMRQHDLPTDLFHTLIDGRETDLSDIQPKDIAALEEYAEATSSALVSLAARCLAKGDPPQDLVRHTGIAIALCGLAQAIPFQAAAGRVTLPADLCKAAGLDPSHPHQWPDVPDVRAITKPMLEAAERHLRAARDQPCPPKAMLPAFLPLSLTSSTLKRFKRVDGDPYALMQRPPGAGRMIGLLLRSFVGRL